jgi:peptide/nickel transport system permease protein
MGEYVVSHLSPTRAYSRTTGARKWFERFFAFRSGQIGGAIVLLYLLLAVFGPLIAPYNATDQSEDVFAPPSTSHLFGTDRYGRDVFSRVILGTRDILTLSVAALVLAVVGGTVVGMVSGYQGGRLDELLMRTGDILMALPALLLAMVVAGLMGPGYLNLVLILGLLYIPRVARVVRSAILDLKTREFVVAAQARGESPAYIMFSEILPNALGPIGVEAALRFCYAIFDIAALGFLGVGLRPPAPDWGLQVNEGRAYILSAPWVTAFPTLAIAGLVIGVNFTADAIGRVIQGRAR